MLDKISKIGLDCCLLDATKNAIFTGSSSCASCEGGSKCDQGVKTECLAGSYSPSSSAKCFTCHPGTYSSAAGRLKAGGGGGSLLPEFKAEYQKSDTFLSLNPQCDPKFYPCLFCQGIPGFRENSEGSEGNVFSSLIKCPAGSASCTTCSPGHLCDTVSETECPAGSYSPGGAVQCTECISGTFSDSAAATLCTECPADFECTNKTKTPCKTGAFFIIIY